MIVGLTGSICAGKETMADYLVKNCGFQKINLVELFREEIGKECTKSAVKRAETELKNVDDS